MMAPSVLDFGFDDYRGADLDVAAGYGEVAEGYARSVYQQPAAGPALLDFAADADAAHGEVGVGGRGGYLGCQQAAVGVGGGDGYGAAYGRAAGQHGGGVDIDGESAHAPGAGGGDFAENSL